MLAMSDSLLTPGQSYAFWVVFSAAVSMLPFMRLAAKEWSYREAWIRYDSARRAQRGALQARIDQVAETAGQIHEAASAVEVDEDGVPVF